MINACTIVARNYLAYARVLAASFLAHHPGGQFRVLLIDDEDGSAGSQAADLHCQRLRDIGLSARDVVQLAAIYDVTELATAVKPQFLRFLLDSGLGPRSSISIPTSRCSTRLRPPPVWRARTASCSRRI